jgi:hypothetical protein
MIALTNQEVIDLCEALEFAIYQSNNEYPASKSRWRMLVKKLEEHLEPENYSKRDIWVK